MGFRFFKRHEVNKTVSTPHAEPCSSVQAGNHSSRRRPPPLHRFSKVMRFVNPKRGRPATFPAGDPDVFEKLPPLSTVDFPGPTLKRLGLRSPAPSRRRRHLSSSTRSSQLSISTSSSKSLSTAPTTPSPLGNIHPSPRRPGFSFKATRTSIVSPFFGSSGLRLEPRQDRSSKSPPVYVTQDSPRVASNTLKNSSPQLRNTVSQPDMRSSSRRSAVDVVAEARNAIRSEFVAAGSVSPYSRLAVDSISPFHTSERSPLTPKGSSILTRQRRLGHLFTQDLKNPILSTEASDPVVALEPPAPYMPPNTDGPPIPRIRTRISDIDSLDHLPTTSLGRAISLSARRSELLDALGLPTKLSVSRATTIASQYSEDLQTYTGFFDDLVSFYDPADEANDSDDPAQRIGSNFLASDWTPQASCDSLDVKIRVSYASTEFNGEIPYGSRPASPASTASLYSDFSWSSFDGPSLLEVPSARYSAPERNQD